MLFTNSLRMSQERPSASVYMTASFPPSRNTFLQMVFINDNGGEMVSALHKYPLNTVLVKNYIEKIYSASIRQNFVALIKASDIMQKQMKEWMSSFSANAPRFPSGSVIAWRHFELHFKLESGPMLHLRKVSIISILCHVGLWVSNDRDLKRCNPKSKMSLSHVTIISLDFSKAFDTIRHSTLAIKLARVDIPDSIFNWIINYLQDRGHMTRFAGRLSG